MNAIKWTPQGIFYSAQKAYPKKIYGKFIDHCRKIDPSLTADKLIHMDINGTKEEIYAIGWCLVALTETHYSKKTIKNFNEALCLKITLSNHVTTFNFLKKERYNNTLRLIETLINT